MQDYAADAIADEGWPKKISKPATPLSWPDPVARRRWTAGVVLGAVEHRSAGSQGAARLPGQQCPVGQARPVALEGPAAPALPDPGQWLLGAREARQGQGQRLMVPLQPTGRP